MAAEHSFLFLAHTASCIAMTGLIWLIQVVHYPSFHFIHDEKFLAFHQFHSTYISLIVIPLMTFEAVTGAYLWLAQYSSWAMGLNLLGIVLIWAATFFLSVPLHAKLGEGMNTAVIDALIRTNGVRTALWSVRTILLLQLLSTRS